MVSYVFGPVPSRRLGRSIGINNIPAKTCSYACLYCQVGKTTHWLKDRRTFYQPDCLVEQTRRKIAQLKNPQEKVDYLTIVADGEPTLDLHMRSLIGGLKSLGFPVAVISNATLLRDKAVRFDLCDADFISIKVDAVTNNIWKRINRPIRGLTIDEIKEGIRQFADQYRGLLVTETMVLKNVNDMDDETTRIAEFLASIQPHIAYIAVPTRPPAKPTVRGADADTLVRLYHRFSAKNLKTELLIGYEGNTFTTTGSAEQDLLCITAVHPMREDAVAVLLQQTREPWSVVTRLLRQKKLKKIFFNDYIYYARRPEKKQSRLINEYNDL